MGAAAAAAEIERLKLALHARIGQIIDPQFMIWICQAGQTDP